MIDYCKRIGVICEIVNSKPYLGKTALMKFVFLLQRIYNVPLGYNFEIYNYGPYSSEVMEDIDFAKHQDIISMDTIVYPTGYYGYSLLPTENTEKYISGEEEFISYYKEPISKIIELFGSKSVKDLELSTTIIFLYYTYRENKWDNSSEKLLENVHEIKPHFDIDTIEKEYDNLIGLGLLEMTA